MKKITQLPHLSQINFRHLLSTRRFIITAVAAIVVSILMILLGIVPQFLGILELQKEVKKQQKILTELKNKQSSLTETDTLYLVSSSEKVDVAMPSKKPLLELMAGVNQVVERNGVIVSQIELRPGLLSTESASDKKKAQKQNVDYDSLDINLQIEGELDQISSFIQEIEKIVPFSNVVSISLDEQRKKTLDVPVRIFAAELSIRTYYYKKSIVVKLETQLPGLSEEGKNLLVQLNNYIYPKYNPQQQIVGGGSIDPFQVKSVFSQPIEVKIQEEEIASDSGETSF